MDTTTVPLQLPNDLYNKLQFLSANKRKKPVDIIAQLIATAYQEYQPQSSTPAIQNILENAVDLGVTNLSEHDPVFELLGAYQSEAPLIDDIPVSEDPDLYLLAEAMGEDVAVLHAWEISPGRYVKGNDGRAVRRKAKIQ